VSKNALARIRLRTHFETPERAVCKTPRRRSYHNVVVGERSTAITPRGLRAHPARAAHTAPAARARALVVVAVTAAAAGLGVVAIATAVELDQLFDLLGIVRELMHVEIKKIRRSLSTAGLSAGGVSS